MKLSLVLCLLSVAACYAEITVKVQNVVVMEGETATIPCGYTSDVDLENATSSSNDSTPTITWYATNAGEKRLYQYIENDKTETFKDAGITRELSISNGALVIPNTEVVDNLEFSKLKCTVDFSDSGSKSADLDFLVAKLPQGEAKMSLSTGAEEGFDIVENNVNVGSCTSQPGYPAADIKFYRKKDGKAFEVKTGLVWDVLQSIVVNKLSDGVTSVTQKDLVKVLEPADHQAEFICSVITKYGDQADVQNFTMPKFNIKYDTDKAEFKASAPNAYLGETMTLTCEANGFPDASITIDGEPVSSVQFEVTKEDDGKTFTCVAGNGGEDVETTYTLNVLSLTVPAVSGPNNVMLGESATLNCTAMGTPEPEVAWYKGDGKVRDSGILYFEKAEFTDSAKYECRADNGHEALKTYAEFDFSVRGIVIMGEETVDIEGKKDETVELICEVESNPKPTFTWDVPEATPVETMIDNKYQSIVEVGPLSPELSEKVYTCTAENADGGMIKKTFKLPVIEEPSSPVAGIIIAILVIILVVAIILAVLYNKGIICKKGEKGEESAEGDIAVEINNEDDVEAGNGKPDDAPAPPEEEKLMNGDGSNE